MPIPHHKTCDAAHHISHGVQYVVVRCGKAWCVLFYMGSGAVWNVVQLDVELCCCDVAMWQSMVQ